jgi:PKD repeat protein
VHSLRRLLACSLASSTVALLLSCGGGTAGTSNSVLPTSTAIQIVNIAAAPTSKTTTPDCGAAWMSSLQQLSTLPTSNPVDNVQIISWNDYEAGSQIEAGIDNCVFITPTLAADTLSWQVTGNTDTIDHYAVFASTDGTNLTLIAKTTPATNSLALGNLNLTAGTQYTMYVQAVGKPSVLNKISPPASYTPVTKQAPVIQLAVSPTSGVAPLAVSSSITSSGTIVSNSIDFGDGTVINSASGSHIYASAGTYTVKATATNNYGLNSTATATVSAAAANQPPVAKLSVTPTSGTTPVTVSASTAGSTDPNTGGAIASSVINFGDGTVVNTASGTHAYTTAGTYTVTATVTDNLGLSSLATVTVSIAAPPVVAVAVTPANASTTTGATQQFAASVTGTANAAVTWTASGTGCSGATCGTISSSGLYTAPPAVPSPPIVTVTATSVSDPTKSASAAVTIVPRAGATYYLAPAAAGGNDSNNGLSPNAPWLTPHHSINCGDVIFAATSASYAQANFQFGKWGTVTCAAGNNVATLQCAIFDGCKMSITSGTGFTIDQSYWMVTGWEVDGTISTGACYWAYPNNGVTIHHIIFANDIASGCGQGGLTASQNESSGVDYFVVVGSVAYNDASGSSLCTSGINSFEPVASDSLPGTHYYYGGNFSWDNVEPAICNSGAPTDGVGLYFDTVDGSQTSITPYTQQMVMDNNISIFNGSRGMEVLKNSSGTTHAPVYLRHNTLYGNNESSLVTQFDCAELVLDSALHTEAYGNLAMMSAASPCPGNTPWVFLVNTADATDHIYSNYGYSAAGNNMGINSGNGFTAGPNNTFGTNPNLANPVNPGAPNCTGYASVPACMAQVIANFTPTNPAAAGYGYQIPSGTPIYDPLFPQWLCNVNLPAGLVTMGCQAAP